MDSLVRPRPNHYELLGLTPAATGEEIGQAFERAIGALRPLPFGGTAALSVAYATLRDPVKRRAYDDSLGLTAKPVQTKPLQGWRYAGPVRVSRPGQAAVAPEPKASPRPEADAVTEPQSAPFIAEAPTRPAIEPHVEADRHRQTEPRSGPRPEPQDFGIRARPAPVEMRLLPMEEDESDWKRPVLLGGGLFAGVALLGMLAGLWASRDVQQGAPEEVAGLTAPAEARAATPAPAAEAKPGTTGWPKVEAPSPRVPERPPTKPTAAKPPVRASSPPQPSPVADEQSAEDVPDIPTDRVAALASKADETPAAMPLSDATVARTIGRIGYSCGRVASKTAVEGSPGVFKVTCTSGETYRAAPVHGRYHFRRWAG